MEPLEMEPLEMAPPEVAFLDVALHVALHAALHAALALARNRGATQHAVRELIRGETRLPAVAVDTLHSVNVARRRRIPVDSDRNLVGRIEFENLGSDYAEAAVVVVVAVGVVAHTDPAKAVFAEHFAQGSNVEVFPAPLPEVVLLERSGCIDLVGIVDSEGFDKMKSNKKRIQEFFNYVYKTCEIIIEASTEPNLTEKRGTCKIHSVNISRFN